MFILKKKAPSFIPNSIGWPDIFIKKSPNTVKNMYDIYYDGIIKDAYDTEDYDVWSDASSDAYDDWSNCLSDIYDVWSDMQSDIYEFQSDLRSEVYDHDDERAQKKMDKFKKSILRMKEDAND